MCVFHTITIHQGKKVDQHQKLPINVYARDVFAPVGIGPSRGNIVWFIGFK